MIGLRRARWWAAVVGILAPARFAGQTPAPIPVGPLPAPTISQLMGSPNGLEGEGMAFGVSVANPSGEALTFAWDMGDGTASSQSGRRSLTHRYVDTGTFTVRLSVSGSRGFSAERQLDVTIENAPPIIYGLEADPDGQPGAPIAFEAAAVDAGGDTDGLTYTWDFGDGSPPVSGVGLDRPSHTYADGGTYDVTLTVTDEDGAEATRTITVTVNPGFLGHVAGEVPQFTFQGRSGPATLSSGLGGVNLFSGAAPMSGGVADLSGMFGICLVNAGFWDDRSKAHINFILTLPADRAFEPQLYTVGWEASDGGIPPGQLLINALVMWIDPIYEKTKQGAYETNVAAGGGILDLIRRGLSGELQEEPLGPGRNWTLTANAGLVEIERVTPEYIEGHLQAYFNGAWVEADRSGRTAYAEAEGDFRFRLDDAARANLLRCADRPFTLESHTPEVEERLVDFVHPDVTLAFNQPVDPRSIDARTVQVGYLTSASAFQPVDGTLSINGDGRTVVFTPDERLLDAVFYHVRVAGGQNGVTSATGDPLPGDYEWRFGTVVDLLERRGDGGTPD